MDFTDFMTNYGYTYTRTYTRTNRKKTRSSRSQTDKICQMRKVWSGGFAASYVSDMRNLFRQRSFEDRFEG